MCFSKDNDTTNFYHRKFKQKSFESSLIARLFRVELFLKMFSVRTHALKKFVFGGFIKDITEKRMKKMKKSNLIP